MSEKTPVIYVWSASDEERYNRYQNTVRWILVPIILLGLLMLVVTIWAFIEFRSCSWKLAPPTVSLPVLIILLITSLIILLLALYGLSVLSKETADSLKFYLRIIIIFIVLSVIMMIILWIYTVYKRQDKFKREKMQLAYMCFDDVAECWDKVQKMHNCCGWNSPKDWSNIPMSCCDPDRATTEVCSSNQTSIPSELAFQDGCIHHLRSRSLLYIILAGISWAIVVLLFLAFIFLGIHLLRGLKIKDKLRPLLG